MKKNLIAKMTWTIVGTILSITIMAQEKQSLLLRYGVKAGVQLSTIQKGSSEAFSSLKIKPRLGYQVGGFATIGLSDEFSLQAELFFSSQGFKESMIMNVGGGESEEHTEPYSMRYIKLPVLLRYSVTKNIFIEAGPQFGVFVSSNIERDEWTHFKKFDLAGALGAEYILSDKLSAQLRYAHSFAKIDNIEDYLWVHERPRVFSLGLAYTF
ncbi:MAG: PorT family protein [Chitinophagaceae bacterium]|nr:PorT family protein [Chitinophagaceae bacterium]